MMDAFQGKERDERQIGTLAIHSVTAAALMLRASDATPEDVAKLSFRLAEAFAEEHQRRQEDIVVKHGVTTA
jgi:hypothetical protein